MLQRSVLAHRGPRFFEQDGELMFEHVIDGSNRIGPRPATDDDRRVHPQAYADMGGEDPAPVEAVTRRKRAAA